MKYYIKTFGCQQNKADSERIARDFKSRGMTVAKNYQEADYIVINTCMIRESAENRVYGLVNNLNKQKNERKFKIIVTGCMVGMAFRDKTGLYLKKIREKLPGVDEFMPIEEVGFDFAPLRTDRLNAWVPISNGCNNFCTFCVVPFTRGREISRPFEDIIKECQELIEKGYKNVTLLGQNVNSYGADLVASEEALRDLPAGRQERIVQSLQTYGLAEEERHERQKLVVLKPVYVKHLGRYRIPTLFPHLLEEVAKIGFEKVDFISSNPWDFSDELIDVIAKNKNITRTIHLPVQSGDDTVLKRMNRWYTAVEYLRLISKIKNQILNIKFTTDIIVGFCGETDEEFRNTVDLCKKVEFSWAFVSVYSQRPMAASTKIFKDDIPHTIKDKRWKILDDLINKPRLKKKIK
ncbi:radical SAM protein [Candidatus Roizmanbacteria bacterium]|nr:radical SAM protein [Candidatus Roizmanbacteria bacterium]